MCMEDVRLGRATKVTPSIKALTAASQLIIDAAELRRTLTLFPPPSGTTTFFFRGPVVDDFGIILNAGEPPLHFSVDTHGDIVTRAWFAIHSAGAVSMAILEGLLEAK